jgi:hypothetical protein
MKAFLQFTYLELDRELAQSLKLVKNGKNSGNNNDSPHGEKMRRGKFC